MPVSDGDKESKYDTRTAYKGTVKGNNIDEAQCLRLAIDLGRVLL